MFTIVQSLVNKVQHAEPTKTASLRLMEAFANQTEPPAGFKGNLAQKNKKEESKSEEKKTPAKDNSSLFGQEQCDVFITTLLPKLIGQDKVPLLFKVKK